MIGIRLLLVSCVFLNFISKHFILCCDREHPMRLLLWFSRWFFFKSIVILTLALMFFPLIRLQHLVARWPSIGNQQHWKQKTYFYILVSYVGEFLCVVLTSVYVLLMLNLLLLVDLIQKETGILHFLVLVVMRLRATENR